MDSKIIFLPFLICGIAMAGQYIAFFLGKHRMANIFKKLFTIGFLLFWFGFLIVAVFICIRDKNYNMLAFTLPFWIAGIYMTKKRLMNTQTKEKAGLRFPAAIIISSLLVLFVLIVGILILIQGIKNLDKTLMFMGGFFAFGSFTFVLGVLTVKGVFDKCKVDVLGLYVGILFVVIGAGIIAMIYHQDFGVWIIIPVLMIGVGILQIIKCIKNQTDDFE